MLMKRLLPVVLVLASAAGCSDNGGTSPVTPTPNPTPAVTRVLALEGDLSFGDVIIGATAEKVVRIANRGTGPLTVTGLAVPGGGAVTANWTSGTIGPSQSQDVRFRFTPTAIQNYSGTMTVNADHTSGTNTIAVTARGQRERWSRTGVGDATFDMPLDVVGVRLIGVSTAACQPFTVRIATRPPLVDVVLGTCPGAVGPRYDQVLATGSGGAVSITNATAVSWSFEEIR